MNLASRPRSDADRNGEATHRFTVAQYLRMVEVGILDERDKVELIAGRIVPKMSRNPSHDGRLSRLLALLLRRIPADWVVRCQCALVLIDSVPEPDFTVVRGPDTRYLEQHPAGRDAALAIEVSNASLTFDRKDKLEVYARSGVPVYWIVNLVDEVIEEYSEPRNGRSPGYQTRKVHHPSDTIVLKLGSRIHVKFPVSEILMLPRS